LFRLIRTTTIKISNQGLSSNGYVAVGFLKGLETAIINALNITSKGKFGEAKQARNWKDRPVEYCTHLYLGVLYRCICPINKSSKTKP